MRAATVLVIFLASGAAYGDKLYKWTDKDGHVHYEDKVPQEQTRTANELHLNHPTVTDEQRKEAEAIYARDKAILIQQHKPDSTPTPTPTVTQPDVTQPSQNITPPTDAKSKCEEEWRKYRESLECVAPYRTAYGGIKEEAAQHCTFVKSPAEFCD